ncbi:MAG: MFS transporter [Sphingomonadaceae bacterium]
MAQTSAQPRPPEGAPTLHNRGLGAVAGALSSGWLRARTSTEGIVRIGSMAVAIGTAGTAVSTDLWLTLPALMIAGTG